MKWIGWIAIALTAGTASAQNLVCNGGFEEPQFNQIVSLTQLPCWTVTIAQPIEVQNKSLGVVDGVLGTQYVELDVSANTTIYQDIPTVIGQRYLVGFSVANRKGAPGGSVNLVWDGAVVAGGSRTATQTTFTKFVWEQVATKTVSRVGFAAAGVSDGVSDLLDEVTVTPIPAAGSRLSYTYYIPHFADGAGWKSDISIVNASPLYDTQVEYTVYGTNGAELDSRLKSSFLLPFRRSTVIESPGSAILRTGWVKILSNEPLNVFVIFRSSLGALDLEASVPARTPTIETIAPFDNAGFITGFAVMNPGAAAITVTSRFYDTAGALLGTDTIPLQAREQTSFVLADRIAAVRGKKGSVQLSAADAQGNPAPFTPLGLRFNSGGAFTTLPY